MRFLVPLLLASCIPLVTQAPASTPGQAPVPAPGQAATPPAEPVSIAPQEALVHRIGHDQPAYPRFAAAAGVAGTVKILVTIGGDGRVQTQSTVSGPPALILSAQAWIAASQFRPIVRDGQPIAVTATLPVVFNLPAGGPSAHPVPAIYQRNITTTIDREGRDNPPRVPWVLLSPAVHDWLARYEAALANQKMQPGAPLDTIIEREDGARPLLRTPGNLAIYQIPLTLPHHHLYALFEFSNRCGKANCPLVLLEESATAVRVVASQPGLEVDLHRRHDSPYPDLLVWSDSGQSGISTIAGYSYYAGQWGQLYCGTDDAFEDSERDERAADKGVHPSHPPIATLCK